MSASKFNLAGVSRFARAPVLGAATLLLWGGNALFAQGLNTTEEVAPDGSVVATVEMTFDASQWLQWKPTVGDQPARLRAMMKHHLGAQFSIDDFKLERDDLNRKAKMTLTSAVGPALTRDGRFSLPVEKEFRLVTGADRVWFFSGNNPLAGNTLNTIKVILPENLAAVKLLNVGDPNQALVYTLKLKPGTSRRYVWAGIALLGFGSMLLGAELRAAKRRAVPSSEKSQTGFVPVTPKDPVSPVPS